MHALGAAGLSAKLIEARGLTYRFPGAGVFARSGVRAITDVSLAIAAGETLGLVGESGSGKSTLGRLLLGLLRPHSGEVRLDGTRLAELRQRTVRRRMQLVFQDPFGSLDPRRRIGRQIADGPVIHRLSGDRTQLVARLLGQVGLAPAHADRLPHAFSGGQRQRIAIARALATRPDFLVADEPVSALDVSVQAQILALLQDLREQLGLAMLFISHDLATVARFCDRTAVLYLGRIMEEGPTERVLADPRHPYTVALLSASPQLDRGPRAQVILAGDPPDPAHPPSGCVFHTRCPNVVDLCHVTLPKLRELAGRRIACHRDDIHA